MSVSKCRSGTLLKYFDKKLSQFLLSFGILWPVWWSEDNISGLGLAKQTFTV